jgi:hypothetical protein
MKKLMAHAVALVGVLALASSASAVPLTPGSTVYFPSGTTAPSPWGTLTPVAGMVSPYASGPVANPFSGTLHSLVYMEAGGTLDFFYQVSANEGAHPIDRISVTGFKGFTTDMYYATDVSILPTAAAGTLGSVPFEKFTRLEDDVIGANFLNGLSGGHTTYWLVVRTNATSYEGTTAYIQDGAQATAQTFCPAPLPSSMVLFATGAVGFVGGIVRRFRRPSA